MTLCRFFSPCPRGLEALLADELAGCGASGITPAAGGCAFLGDQTVEYRVNLESRLATRVLRRVGEADFRHEEDLYRFAREIAWPTLFAVRRTIRVYVTAIKTPLKSLEFVTLRVKDAVCDRFRLDTGRRPDVDTAQPQVRIHLFLNQQRATLYLDTSGEALWQRGHKAAKVQAPLKENLAAGILRLTGWRPDQPLLDPMCGSGTFLLEAASIALDDAPGLARSEAAFGFTRLLDYDETLWRNLRRAAAQRRRSVERLAIFGSDSDHDAIVRSHQNLAHAGLDDLITLEQADLLERAAPASSGVLIANPPYGARLGEAEQLAAFYPRLGDALKKNFTGWQCWFLSADTRLPKLIGLKAERRIPLYNGELECRLYGFTMHTGSFRRFQESASCGKP